MAEADRKGGALDEIPRGPKEIEQERRATHDKLREAWYDKRKLR